MNAHAPVSPSAAPGTARAGALTYLPSPLQARGRTKAFPTQNWTVHA